MDKTAIWLYLKGVWNRLVAIIAIILIVVFALLMFPFELFLKLIFGIPMYIFFNINVFDNPYDTDRKKPFIPGGFLIIYFFDKICG